eukprot:TRINITY_DN2575_c0_g1_i10.p1 TRINITY_DN2575_c0_g1~~TRINITY_DN2575_c0_g1_i10.p1  ORF type:complete len:121 (-),score=21.38 TRINITY_DN2575_c0_g1_i10:301-663(-)
MKGCRTKTSLTGFHFPLPLFFPSFQVVLSGDEDFVMKVSFLSKEKLRVRRLHKLDVSCAFHSPLLESVKNELKLVMAGLTVKDPLVPLISNVGAEIVCFFRPGWTFCVFPRFLPRRTLFS